MRRTRVVPILLLQGRGLYKTSQFRKPVYVGDPINVIRIFNDKEVDEIVVLDIGATKSGEPQYDRLAELASECFMPLAYGGGITNLNAMQRLFRLGVEKCILNTSFYENPNLITQAAREFGGQSVVVSIDVRKRRWGGTHVYSHGGKRRVHMTPVEAAREAVDRGAGEILLTSIDREGTMEGYDTALIQQVSSAVSVPVVANGGAGSVQDFASAVRAGASAVSAGAFFVFTGRHRAVLVTVPSASILDQELP